MLFSPDPSPHLAAPLTWPLPSPGPSPHLAPLDLWTKPLLEPGETEETYLQILITKAGFNDSVSFLYFNIVFINNSLSITFLFHILDDLGKCGLDVEGQGELKGNEAVSPDTDKWRPAKPSDTMGFTRTCLTSVQQDSYPTSRRRLRSSRRIHDDIQGDGEFGGFVDEEQEIIPYLTCTLVQM